MGWFKKEEDVSEQLAQKAVDDIKCELYLKQHYACLNSWRISYKACNKHMDDFK